METKFIKFIKDTLEMEDKNLALDDKFKEYEEWDSLAHLSLIAEIDDVYNVVIEDEAFKKLNTLQDLYTEIQKRTNV